MCLSKMSKYTLERAENEANGNEKLTVISSGCQGNCGNAPSITIEKGSNKQQLSHVDAIKMGKIIDNL